MNSSDRQYLSRFALDPVMEYRWEDLYEFDFYCLEDEEIDPINDENILDAEDTNPDDEILSND
jgi:hypothetical protein